MQNVALAAMADGAHFDTVADMVCRQAEALSHDSICTIAVIEPNGRMRSVAAPSLPKEYAAAVNELTIGPMVGSCGSAAYHRRPIQVTDIETDPRWASYKSLALSLGLRSCWSIPIMQSDGKVAATFAFYSRESREANKIERAIAQTCVHLCRVSIAFGDVLKRNFTLAHFDRLSGLPNRHRFEETLLSKLTMPDGFGLIILDADHLKTVNDTFGHAAGDGLIAEIAKRLSGLPPEFSAYRIGNDEFAVLLDNCSDRQGLEAMAETVRALMTRPFETNGHKLQPSLSMGGAVRGLDGEDSQALQRNADLALSHAKQTKRGGFVAFDSDLRNAITRRRETILAVNEALGDKRIVSYYQPITDIASGEILGLEALVRMRCPDGRVAVASEFGDAFMDRQASIGITRYMVEQAAADMARWLALGIEPQRLSINLSSADFAEDGFCNDIINAFKRHGVPPSNIAFEITETVIIEGGAYRIAPMVSALHRQGFQLELDDFGTGYASLTHLLELPIDAIKIDKSFISRMESDAGGGAIVEALINIADRMGLKVVAEGIEHASQAQRLLGYGCKLGQGYYFGAPADAATTEQRLIDTHALF
ncbi:EAL domain-containing protein [Jiella sp. MQZ9-1]|nr:EAL domain-containing protein [Jiella flava]